MSISCYKCLLAIVLAFGCSSLNFNCALADDEIPIDEEIAVDAVTHKISDCYVELETKFYPCRGITIPAEANCPNAATERRCTGDAIEVSPLVNGELSNRQVVDPRHPAPRGKEVLGGRYVQFFCVKYKPCKWYPEAGICFLNERNARIDGPTYLAPTNTLTAACKLVYGAEAETVYEAEAEID